MNSSDSKHDRFDEVLLPFLAMMRKELHANTGKGDRPGWLQMDANTALLEVYYHLAKLQKAVRNNDGPGIQEYAADVANMAMMVLDICGGIDSAALQWAASQQAAEGWPALISAEVERATRKFPTWPTDPLHALAVLGEEFGELNKAMLQLTYEPHKTSPEEVRTEAIQTAAMPCMSWPPAITTRCGFISLTCMHPWTPMSFRLTPPSPY